MNSKLTTEQADRLNQPSGQGFRPTSKATGNSLKPPTNSGLVANQSQVLMRQALQDTEVLLGQVDQIWEAAENTVVGYFDQRGEQAKGSIALTIMTRMGLTPESAEASELGFFDQAPLNIQGAFGNLLTSRGQNQLNGQQTIETPTITAAATEVVG